ncbi:hypothetical protein [Salinicoccus halodurans]|uniref:Uncharacterized protein n=1 Tax=Salinicoccus halodurans TaxID=407035 RepID=A0A0F7HKZ3_9STAP|nr:hypothetical protein [Salinicoccus halodurans]AKG74184.1 hypothetical protein AAT16_08025 [Salinicoccus halodurans]SFK61707.1 hypothetical protein SAMN05216235_0853 [Salinicoccus halodurans]
MFSFDFTFLNSGLPVADIIIGGLTVAGTALATFLAAKYTGKNANDIADKNNKHQRKLQEDLLKEESLNQLLISYNNLFHYIESFYDEHNDQIRINSLNINYDWHRVENQNEMENYINDASITLKGLNDLGNVVINQVKDLQGLETQVNNNLLKCKKYFNEEEYQKLESKLYGTVRSFKYILRDGSVLSGTKNLSIRGMGLHLIHLYNRATYIKYKINNPEMKHDDGGLILETPPLLSYKWCYENDLTIRPILENAVNSTNI